MEVGAQATGVRPPSPGTASSPARQRGVGSAVPSQGDLEPFVSLALISPSIIEENHLPALPASQGQMELVRDLQEGLACGRDTCEPGPASLPGMVFMASNRPCFPKTEGSRDIGLAVLNLCPRQIGMGSWCGRSPAPAPALLLSRW